MNELHEHKKSDAVKWAVVFILIAVLAAGTAGAWTVLLRDGHAGGAEEQPREETVCPGPAVTDGEGNAMESGVVYAMPAAMVFAATAAEQSSAGDGITLQATVIPEAADNKAVVWSVTFTDPASAWAAGRTVTDYVTVTPSAEDGTQATVKCLQAFGAQITVTVTSRLNAHAKAECVLDYARRITDMSLWSERTDSRLTEFGADEILTDLVMPSFQEFERAMDNGSGVCAENMVALNIDEDHKTSENIKQRGAFTLSIADVKHIEQADFFGIATGNKMADKFARSGLTARKSARVDAPVVEEFPLTLECKVVECQHTVYGFRVLGEIVNVLADESVLDEKGNVDPTRLGAFVFDQFGSGYYALGEKVGQAWHTGAGLMKKQRPKV